MELVQTERKNHIIRKLNDKFRQTFIGGIVSLTPALDRLPWSKQKEIFDLVQSYCLFDDDNDPHGEHDCGCVTYDGEKYVFKIDYYDKHMRGGSPDATNPRVTTRVMTILHLAEY